MKRRGMSPTGKKRNHFDVSLCDRLRSARPKTDLQLIQMRRSQFIIAIILGQTPGADNNHAITYT